MTEEQFDKTIESWKKEEQLWKEEFTEKHQRITDLLSVIEEIHEAATDPEYKHDNVEWIAAKCAEVLYPNQDPSQLEVKL